MQNISSLIGQILLSLIFVVSGVGKMGDWSGTAGYMASNGMVAVPFFLAMAILFEVVGDLSVLTGLRPAGEQGLCSSSLFLLPPSSTTSGR